MAQLPRDGGQNFRIPLPQERPLCRTPYNWHQWVAKEITLPETNIARENKVSQKEITLPTIQFQVRAVSFREGNYLF